MKYQVGELVLIKDVNPPLRPRPRPHPARLRLRLHLRLHLNNTFGIITKVQKHNDIFETGSTENDNGYILYSQVDNKEYYFYENEIVGEVVK